MQSNLSYFTASFALTAIGLGLGGAIGYYNTHTISGAAATVFIVAVLGVLEVALSFDNAVVNATVLREMDQVWRRRFITWGIAIAVFGMRVVFPLVIVAIIAKIGPWAAVVMAATEPNEYSRVLASAHVSLSAFGGAFLSMVGLKYFLDAEKQVHWIGWFEEQLVRLGKIEAVELAAVMLALWGVSSQLNQALQVTCLVSGMLGLVTYVGVGGISALLERDGRKGAEATKAVARSGFAAFLYLEVVDASFSFDGVIGAFALSNNLFVISIGLGVGAMFVRSLTLLLVENGTLAEYRYLEHGAFYAIIALGVIMLLKTFMHLPEAVTGLIGAGFIGLAFLSSLRFNRARKAHEGSAEYRVATPQRRGVAA